MDKYTCEVETTVGGLDVLVHGSIERVVTGVDDGGAPVEEHHVVVEDVFAAVTMETNAPGCYCDYPLASIPIAWKDELVGAICARSEADWERWEEDKADRPLGPMQVAGEAGR